ncbi:SusC/RagA family TonB-linked outer membrane protein [uncultured Formosa sp.]|uniref:SusC/RagA family TonB-linked outer membrane protein n=1 Tax=uncultured Formosa sp. TaxID=255435 RepID=UPI0026098FAF|nr:SusC/RagA family TonB-linked outer membrane protein [uncultured Formosa sp.]
MYKNYNFKKSSIKPALFMALLLSLSYGSVFAANDTDKLVDEASVSEQNLTITGNVTSVDDGMPLAGVNVILKGVQGVGTVTDFDGNYSLDVPSSTSVLMFSSIGYVSQEVSVAGNTKLNIQLETNISELDEVIVVGFGTQKKATLTGSVAQVKGDDVVKGKGTSSAVLALQGEVPGLVVTRTSSRPGVEGTSINIRGDISVNSISPLILLDGVEISQSDLSAINANDIETYSVLKDASAAIFGTKAAGGVILVTTKKGKEGKMQISYKGETQLNFAKDFPVANMKEWADAWLVAGRNDAVNFVDGDGNQQTAATSFRFFTEDEFMMISNGTMPMAPNSYFWLGKDHYFSDTSQFDAVYGTTITERHDFSLSGGNENATYRSSFGYANERSPISFVYDGQKRYNFRTNVSYKVNDLVKTDFNISYNSDIIDTPTQGVGYGIQDMNIFPLYNPAGQFYDNFGSNNPLAFLKEGGRVKDRTNIFRLGGKITLDLDKYIEGLNFSYFGNISITENRKNKTWKPVTMYDWEGNVTGTPTTLVNSKLEVTEADYVFQNHIFQLNYNRSFGNHNLGVMAGYTAELTETEKYFMSRSNLVDASLNDLNAFDVTTQTNSGGSNNVALVSYLGKINYDYNGIYLLEVLGRRDGSSRLHPDYRWKNFFGASTGIVLSEMSFMDDSVINLLKLRASYGETGSVTGITAYDYYSSIGNGTVLFGSTPQLAATSYINGLSSLDRTWERVSTSNIAVDFGLLNNRLTGTAEYYIRKNDGMLVNVTYPNVLGVTAPKTNSGDFETKGYELSLNWRDRIGDDFTYRVGLAFWDNESEVKRMEGKNSISIGSNSIIEGKPLNAIYAYKTDGLLKTEDQVLNYYNQVGFEDPSTQEMKDGTKLPNYRSADRLVPGTVNRVDVSGDGIIDQDDLVYVGDANPHKSFGINLGFTYKNFDFSAFFQGVGEVNIVRTGSLSYPFQQWWTNQNPTFTNKTWTPENSNSNTPAAFVNTSRKVWNYDDLNDINVIKGAYLRAKAISVGYGLPQDVLDKMGMDKVRLSLTGNDLFTISNIRDGLDPEFGEGTRQGSMIPFTSALIFGVELAF